MDSVTRSDMESWVLWYCLRIQIPFEYQPYFYDQYLLHETKRSTTRWEERMDTIHKQQTWSTTDCSLLLQSTQEIAKDLTTAHEMKKREN